MKRNPSFHLLEGVEALVLAIGLPAYADYPSAVQADNPLAYYRFSETNVVTGTAPTAAVNLGTAGDAANGTDSSSTAIKKGFAGPMATADSTSRAYFFSGGDSTFENINDFNDLAVSGSFTVEFWAKPCNGDDFSSIVTFANWVSPRSGWIVNQSNNGDGDTGQGWMFRGYCGSGSTAAFTALAPMTLDTNHWYHLVCVYDASVPNVRLYVDGQLKDTESSSGFLPLDNSDRTLTLGARGNHGSAVQYDWPGYMSEFAFYNSALTTADVSAHFNAATTNAVAYPTLVKAANPLCYLRLNEFYTAPVAVNSATSGASLNAIYENTSSTTDGIQITTYPGFGTPNTALQLGGNSTPGYVQIPPLGTTVSGATFECWLKRNGTQADTAGLIIQRDNVSCGLSLQSDGQQLAYNWNDNASDWQWNSGLIPPDGTWTYAAIAIDSTKAVMYMYDGSTWSAATNLVSHSSQSFADTISIGNDPINSSRYYNGLLDEVAIYPACLSEGQLRSHLEAALGTQKAPVLLTDPPVLETKGAIYAGWPFTISADSYGTAPITYQWYKNGTAISGATNRIYTVATSAGTDSGSYDVVAANSIGSITNKTHLTVTVITTTPDVTNNIVAWYKFDSTSGSVAIDNSGNAYNGTLQNFPDDNSQWVLGLINNAISVNPDFYGEQEVVIVPNTDSAFDFSSGLAFTLSAWVYANASAQGVNGGIIARGFGNSGEQYSLDVDSGHFRFFVRDANDQAHVLNTAVAPNGNWQHVCAVFDSAAGTMCLYVDGVVAGSITPPSSLWATDHELSIGARQQYNTEDAQYDFDFIGLIDDVRIYKRGLLPAEVRTLYQAAPVVIPTITVAPQGRSVFPGGSVTLTTACTGTSPLHYQWNFKNSPIVGATNTTFVLSSISTTNVGNYTVTITNGAGSVTSGSANVSLLPAADGTYEAAIINDSPEAYWRFNEATGPTIYDSMGRHDGTTYAYGVVDAEGVYYNFSQSGALTNNSDSSTGFIRDSQNQVRVPYSPDLNTTNFTVEAWACLTSNPLGDDAWYAVLASCGAGASGQKGYAFYASSDATWQSWFYLDSVTKWGVCTGPEFVIGQWAYLAMTYDGTTQRFYVNGALVDSQKVTFHPNTSDAFVIGNGPGEFWLDGLMDEVAYYKTALSDSQIAVHYMLGSLGEVTLPTFTTQPASQTVAVGSTVQFTASATGAGTISYQWQVNGVDISGATGTTLTVTNVYYTDNGKSYTVKASNNSGTMVSSSALLTVTPPTTQTNLIVRVKTGTSGSSTVLELIWPSGNLYTATNVAGPWTAISGATQPYYRITPTNSVQFYYAK